MKKTAVLLYNGCCLFEVAVALEMLKMAEKPVIYFAKDLKPIKSEEGLLIMADYTLEQLQIEEYDSLLITGCNNAKETIEDAKTLEFIDGFYNAGALILLFLLLRYFY
jgi:putative intracellular protease/amidase